MTVPKKKLSKSVPRNKKDKRTNTAVKTKQEVIAGVAEQVVWWMDKRLKKLKGLSHDTMAVNPFLAPIIFDIHGFNNFESLAQFLVAGHLATGYATGFGKLIDEKVLPQVFNTRKLNKKARSKRPLSMSVFDEVDHILLAEDGAAKLLSLKASKWTIQLTMAVHLNKTFAKLIDLQAEGKLDGLAFDEIAVGVFYGASTSLTDKYDIIRGINRGATHDVIDIRNKVAIYAGKDFWAWLNAGERKTDGWVLEGILEGLRQARDRVGSLEKLVAAFSAEFAALYAGCVRPDGSVDWERIARSIN
jgi:hypothetical protein